MLTFKSFENRLLPVMSLAERVKGIINKKTEVVAVKPTKRLSNVLSGSRILEVLEELKDQTLFDFSNEVIEGGQKIVITASWLSRATEGKSQFVISVTEDSISFIGNNASGNYKRLEGKEMINGELIENSLVAVFKDPSIF